MKKINRRNLQRNFVPVQRLYFRNILESVPLYLDYFLLEFIKYILSPDLLEKVKTFKFVYLSTSYIYLLLYELLFEITEFCRNLRSMSWIFFLGRGS